MSSQRPVSSLSEWYILYLPSPSTLQLAELVGRTLIYQRTRFKFEPRLDVSYCHNCVPSCRSCTPTCTCSCMHTLVHATGLCISFMFLGLMLITDSLLSSPLSPSQIIAYLTAAKRLSENELYELSCQQEPASRPWTAESDSLHHYTLYMCKSRVPFFVSRDNHMTLTWHKYCVYKSLFMQICHTVHIYMFYTIATSIVFVVIVCNTYIVCFYWHNYNH